MKKIFYLILFVCLSNLAKSQCAQTLNFDTTICSAGFSETIDAGVLDTSLCSDSVTIIFNATGTPLAGDTNIYMHSAPQFYPFESWRDNYTVGNWGQNNGVGRMTSLGNNKWSITIQPATYYNYSVDSCLNGIWLVFRNYNGAIQDPISGAPNNFFLYTIPSPPTTGDTSVQGIKTNGKVNYLWSDGNTSRVRTFTSAANLTVTATSVGGCTATGSVIIKTAHAPVSLGNNVIRCNPNVPVTLNAGSGFTTYIWLNNAPSSISTYTAVNPGCYWIETIDSVNCTSSSTVQIENSEVNNLSIPDSLATCPGGHVTVDASVNVNRLGDSIIIVYNTTSGLSTLSGATKVYFHSGPQFTPSQGWQGNYTVGNWGQDDGVGEMTSLGNNVWRMAIDPYCYYKINPDSLLTGLWMVFRNADGTETGKDNNGNNIYVPIVNNIPNSTFYGVTASRTARLPLTYTWSNSVSGPANTFSSANTYTVTLSDNSNCSKSASVVVSFSGTPPINLGRDTTVCPGNKVNLTASAGFTHYVWNNNDTTQIINVSSTSLYSVTATDSIGCQSFGSRRVTISNSQVSIGHDTVKCTETPTTLTATGGFATYQWLSGPVGVSTTYTAVNPGPYWIKAVDNSGCASFDTISYHYSDVLGLSMPDTMNTCPGNLLALDPSASIEQHGDSIVINYDATTGQTGLINARKVYMHSGPEFHPGQGWIGAYTVGNWGQDDGLGEMDSMGNNKWRITISPYDYYHVNPDTNLDGIWMVFRSADGLETGKDGNGNNIFLSIAGTLPVSQFFGVYAFRKSEGNITFNWSIPNTTAPDIAVSTSGPYSVTVTDDHGCSNSATVQVTNKSTLSVSLGNDTTVCYGQNVMLDPGNTYTAYSWNTGDTTETVNATRTGEYAVTVSSGNCSASDSVSISVLTHHVSAGNDIVRCNTLPVTLTASSGFSSYLWFNAGASSVSYVAHRPGSYWVKATDVAGCVSYDTVTVTNSAVLALSLPDSLTVCSATPVISNASATINAQGDSLVIIYDATKRTTGLQNAAKVYMHSAPEFTPSVGWQIPYTVGNWGQDNGIGEMTSLGGNKWKIVIDPVNYYHIPPDSALNGVFMVFRNASGSQTGKDNNGQNILVDLTGPVPVSAFSGVTASRKAVSGLSYLWSNTVTTPIDTFYSTGVYYITVSDQNTCSQADSIAILTSQTPQFNLLHDTSICGNPLIVLQADTGYTSYVWSTGASTPFLYVSAQGLYTLTVTNSFGCVGSDSITVDSCSSGNPVPVVDCGSPTAGFIVLSVDPGNSVTYKDLSKISKTMSYLWVFGDGIISEDTGSVVHSYASPGVYYVSLVIKDSCGGISGDTVKVDVNVTGIQSISDLTSINIFPNPSNGHFNLEIDMEKQQAADIILMDAIGNIVLQKNEALAAGRHVINFDASAFASGIYLLELKTNTSQTINRITITK